MDRAARSVNLVCIFVSTIFRSGLLFAIALSFGANIALSASHIQQATFSDVTSRTYTSVGAALGATASGNAIIIGVTFGNVNPVITAKDNHGNTYVQAIKTYDPGHRQGVAILFASNVVGSSSTQITLNFSSAIGYVALAVHEYSGIAAASPLDAISGNLGIGSQISSLSASTSAPGDLVFGIGAEDSVGSGDTFSPGVSFTRRADLGATAAYADEDLTQGAAGPVAATFTLSPARSWISAMAAFRATNSGGTTGGTGSGPKISSLTPSSGSIGASVTVSGTGFGATMGTGSVRFNGVTALVTSWSDTKIVTTVPAGATSGNVTVTANGLTSVGMPFQVTSLAVSISPQSTSLFVGQSTAFSAVVQNDPLGKGVSWSLSGTSCSGSTCGSLINVGTTSVTYVAPATLASSTTVFLTATSLSDSSKTATATITASPFSTGATGTTPTFANNHASGSNTQGNQVNSYALRLPNATLPGNCVIVGFQHNSLSGVSPSVSDDKGNPYTIVAKHDDGRQVLNLAVALNVRAGAQKITISFSGTIPNYVSALASEFYNVAASNAVDAVSGNGGVGSLVSAGTLSPKTNGDLIYQFAVQDLTANPMISWTQGSAPWTLLSADLFDSTAAQYQVQTTAAAITPSLSMAPSQNFNTVAIALKPAAAGTAPPPGIRVARVQHNSIPAWTSSPVHLQFPCTGNLLVVAWIGVQNHDLTSISDGNANSYLSTGAPFGLNQSGDNQIFYAASARTSTSMTGPTLSVSGTDISGSTAVLFDVVNAAASPFDSVAGRATASGLQSSTGSISGALIAPSTANGLVISTIGVTSNTVDGVSPGNFLAAVPNPIVSPNPTDQNNGWALYYNPNTSPQRLTWSAQGGPVNYWASIAVAFKAR